MTRPTSDWCGNGEAGVCVDGSERVLLENEVAWLATDGSECRVVTCLGDADVSEATVSWNYKSI